MKSLSLIFLLFLLYEAASEPEVIRVLQVKPGQNVTLPCDAGDVSITDAEWTRSDLVAPDYILLYSDGHSDPTHQHSSFKGRVQLVDGDLKTGNASLILKNVSRDDNGTYKCRVKTAGSRRNKRAIIKTQPISIIQLLVTDPDDQKGDNNNNNDNNNKDGHSTPLRVGLGAAAAAAAVVLVGSVAVGFFLVRKSKRQRDNEPEPSAAEETGDNLL